MSSEKRTLLLLSSGLRPRYRHDILRALALPIGAQLQFRYQRKYLREDLFEKLTKNGARGHKVLVGYLNASDKHHAPTIVPCRMGHVSETRTEGDFALVRFEVDEFASSLDADLMNFEDELKASACSSEALFPYWEQDNCKGDFCIELTSCPSRVNRSRELATWQTIVKQIGACPDFREEPFFFSVRRLHKLASAREAPPSEGKYVLDANSSYRLEIAHFSPSSPDSRIDGSGASASSLVVTLDGAGLQALAGTRIVVDSPYDVKEISFRTHGESRRLHALMAVSRQVHVVSDGKSSLQDTLDFELPIEIKGAWVKPIFIGSLIGVFLAAQQAVPLLKADQLDVTSGAILLVLGILIGLMVVFGVKKAP